MNAEWMNAELDRLIAICESRLANNQSIDGIFCPYCGTSLSGLFDDRTCDCDDDLRCPCCRQDAGY